MTRAWLLVLLLGACDDWEPDVGTPLFARCLDEDTDPDLEVSFARDIAPILEDRCSFCHTVNGDTPIGIEVAHFDVGSYQTLRAGGAVSGSNVIIPGAPCSSVIVQKIGPAPPFGGRMPLGGPPFLSDEDQLSFHDWIAEGARDN